MGSFLGKAYSITFDGSFNANDDVSKVSPGQCIVGSRNCNTHNGGAEKRGGTELHRAQIDDGITCLGAGQLITRAGTIYDYSAWDNGKVYRNGVEILSGRSTTAKTHFIAAANKMFICNGVDVVKVDTGSAVATIASAASDWSGSAQPTCMALHSKGASSRMFAWGVDGHKEILYYSVSGTYEDFVNSGSGTVPIDGITDDDGITVSVSKDNNLWVFSHLDTFILDDEDSTHTNWGYFRASFKGGAHSPRHVVVARNSIFAMNSEMDIHEVQTAQQLRDYHSASITRPFFIHTYLATYAKASQIDDFHMAYDPKVEALKAFIVKTGNSTVTEALVYYITQTKWAPPHDSDDNLLDSGYSAAASYTGRASAGDERLFTCDYNGVTWKLEDDAKADNDNAYTGVWVTGWHDFDLIAEHKLYDFARLHHVSRGDYDITFKWFVDGAQQANQTVTLESNGSSLGSFVLDTSILATIGISDKDIDLGQEGRLIQFHFENGVENEDFFLSSLITYFLSQGAYRKS